MVSKDTEIPAIIFGLKCSQHRAWKMRPVLLHFEQRCGKSSTKNRLLALLARLEHKRFVRAWEKKIITEWFACNTSQTIADALVNDIDRSKFVASDKEQKAIINAAEAPKTANLDRQVRPLSYSECTVCMEVVTSDRFPEKSITASCKHNPTLCKSCLTLSIDAQIPDSPWDQIKCPECDAGLPFDIVKAWASQKAFTVYDKKVLLAVFAQMPNFTMCLVLNCDSGQIHEGGDAEPIMTCDTCNFKTCFTHKIPWHTGLSCDQYEEERRARFAEEEKASAAYLSKDTKICPNKKCGLHVVKVTGCDHITCHSCKHQYCWSCLASYAAIRQEGNSAHETKCPYYRAIQSSAQNAAIIHAYETITHRRTPVALATLAARL